MRRENVPSGWARFAVRARLCPRARRPMLRGPTTTRRARQLGGLKPEPTPGSSLRGAGGAGRVTLYTSIVLRPPSPTAKSEAAP